MYKLWVLRIVVAGCVYKGLSLETLETIIVGKFFVLDRNTWNHI